DRPQDGRLARAVRSDQREPLAGANVEVEPADDDLGLVRDSHAAQQDVVHSAAALVDLITMMKKGAPTTAVITPIGSSAGAATMRAAVSARTRNAAPNSSDSGMTTR